MKMVLHALFWFFFVLFSLLFLSNPNEKLLGIKWVILFNKWW